MLLGKLPEYFGVGLHRSWIPRELQQRPDTHFDEGIGGIGGNRRLTPEHRWRMNVGNWGTAPKSNGTGVFHWYTVSDGSSFGSVPEEGLCLLPSRARNFAHFVTSITSR